MAAVTIKYLGNFILATRKKQEEIVIDKDERVGSLIDKIRKKYGDKLFDSPMTVVWVNKVLCDKDTILQQGDEITLHHKDELIIGTLVGGG
ncbi:MAG: MoaD/ThiS family protein [Candidatus Stahlbacteria bacterium]|nr:MoaD/ThiS family protein [Candidatus Stahlbacteria bacterium]